MVKPLAVFALFFVLATAKADDPKSVRLFVALCDNESQGIVPVPEKIGDGDVPDANLYWGCSDGFGSFFKRSTRWKVKALEEDVSPKILRRMSLSHMAGDVHLGRGSLPGIRNPDVLGGVRKGVGVRGARPRRVYRAQRVDGVSNPFGESRGRKRHRRGGAVLQERCLFRGAVEVAGDAVRC